PNRVLVDVNAAAADIERVFQLQLKLYRHPKESRVFFAPVNEPRFAGPVSILGISGLDDYMRPRALLRKLDTKTRLKGAHPLAGSAPGGNFMGNDFRAAYVPGIAATGLGQVVGLLEFDGYYTNDITAYENLAGLPPVTLKNVLLDNFDGGAGSGNA